MTPLILLILAIVLIVGVLILLARSSRRKSTSKRCDWICPKCNCEIEKWMEGGSPPELCQSCGHDLRAGRFSLDMRLWRRWCPELDLFPPQERGRALKRASNSWQHTLSLVPIQLLIIFAAERLVQILRTTLPLPPWVAYVLVALMMVGLVTWAVSLTTGRIRRELRQQLIDAGFAICGPCGYDLRGLTEPRCPECGAPFDERLLKKNT